MCCIFTCCGWLLDIIQKCWTFLMSCVISAAVCCVLLAAAMAGIALGYNYSLAEYVDLKETNVSVYLKRGMFDDEVRDEKNWRRSGHLPIQGHLGEDRLMTGGVAEVDDTGNLVTQPSRRRLDDSIIEADDSYKFEGNLMKLAGKITPPGQLPSQGYATRDSDVKMKELEESNRYQVQGSLDHLKAIQGLINRKKAESQPVWTINTNEMTEPTVPTVREYTTQRVTPNYQPEDVIKVPQSAESGRRAMHPLNYDSRTYGNAIIENEMRPPLESGRRMLNPQYQLGPYRAAVPEINIQEWKLAKNKLIPYPKPVAPQIGPKISGRPTRPNFNFNAPPPARMRAYDVQPKPPDEDVKKFKARLFQGSLGRSDDESPKYSKNIDADDSKMPDYDEENGVPVRKKREVLNSGKIASTTMKYIEINKTEQYLLIKSVKILKTKCKFR